MWSIPGGMAIAQVANMYMLEWEVKSKFFSSIFALKKKSFSE